MYVSLSITIPYYIGSTAVLSSDQLSRRAQHPLNLLNCVVGTTRLPKVGPSRSPQTGGTTAARSFQQSLQVALISSPSQIALRMESIKELEG